jgi:hypothetical protein
LNFEQAVARPGDPGEWPRPVQQFGDLVNCLESGESGFGGRFFSLALFGRAAAAALREATAS